MATQNKDITYINKDFNDIRSQLINFSQTYFPNTYTDFSPASPGMMFIEQASYVSDVLSFYLDNQIQENYIQYAKQTNNLYNLAYMFSYKPKVTGLSSVDIDLYQQIPSKVDGTTVVPDFDYAIYVEPNSTVTSNSGDNFIIQDPVDFSISNNLDPTETSISQINGTTGEPEFYLLKKSRKGTSGTVITETFTLGAYQQFPTLELNTDSIGGIIDIFDSDGNQYYEVDYLGQDLIYNSIKNTNINDPNNYQDSFDTPYILKTKSVNRRFTTRFLNSKLLQIQFGSGKPLQVDEEVIPNADNVGIGLPFGQNKLTTAYSPTNFVFTNTYGIAPYNTTLTVRYLTGGGASANVEAGSLTVVDDTNVVFINPDLSNTALANTIFNSISSNNPLAADGGMDGDTIEEIRQNSLGNFQNQLRTVTTQDYLVRALSMPSNLGVISKAHAQPQKIGDYQAGELPTVLDLYVLSYNINKNLRNASLLLKRNLQTYLSEYRMINDSINIKDAYIINIEVLFDVVVLPNFNNSEVITKCVQSLQGFFNIDKWQINEPIILKDINILLDKVEGVQTVKNVTINNLSGESLGYSKFSYDLVAAQVSGVIYPSIDPMVFEVKNPTQDIKGRVVPL